MNEQLKTFVDYFNVDPDQYEFDGNVLIINLGEGYKYFITPFEPFNLEKIILEKMNEDD